MAYRSFIMVKAVGGLYRMAYEHPPWDIKLLYKSAEKTGSRSYDKVYLRGGLYLSQIEKGIRT
jgi:hypothetical protein